MICLKWCCFSFLMLVCSSLAAVFNQNEIPVTYQLIDREAFQKLAVGNTIVGTTTVKVVAYTCFILLPKVTVSCGSKINYMKGDGG